ACDLRLPGDLDVVTAERMRRELRLWIAEGRFGLAVACDQAELGAAEQIGEGYAAGSAVRLHKDAAVFEGQIGGLALLERRSRRCRGDGEQRGDRLVGRGKDG